MSRATYAHAAAVIAAVVTFSWIFRDQPLSILLFWDLCIALCALAPFEPALGLGAYAALLYGTPRYSIASIRMVEAYLIDGVAILALIGAAIWLRRQTAHRPRVGPLLLAGTALFGWILIAGIVAAARGTQAAYDPAHATRFFVHAFVLMFAVAAVMRGHRTAVLFIVPLTVAMAFRVLWQGRSGLLYENDIGPLLLMIVPLLLACARLEARFAVRVLATLAVLASLAAVALTYNRASAVAFLAVWALTLWHMRKRTWLVLANLAVVIAAGAWVATTPYAARFSAAVSELEGRGTGSVTERLHLWDAGLAMTTDHPLVGVGPGRYTSVLRQYAPSVSHTVAHNSFVHMAAETGVPGVILYTVLFAAAMLVSVQVVRRRADEPSVVWAQALQTSLAAYLIAGLFISRHDMVLAYMFVGWIAALRSQVVEQARTAPAFT